MTILLLLQTILFIHFAVCVYKSIISYVFFVSFLSDCSVVSTHETISLSKQFCSKPNLLTVGTIKIINDPKVSIFTKYAYILDYTIWTTFSTAFGNDLQQFKPGKIVNAWFIIMGVVYNIYILIRILNALNSVHAPRTKYYETMNQLDAFMQKKQLPILLQTRLKFFYRKKFQRFYYREDEILGFLSGESDFHEHLLGHYASLIKYRASSPRTEY